MQVQHRIARRVVKRIIVQKLVADIDQQVYDLAGGPWAAMTEEMRFSEGVLNRSWMGCGPGAILIRDEVKHR
jgi:hypothetical protein